MVIALTRSYYFLTLTNTSVVVNSANRFTNRPGDVNVMTAGAGIVHSERAAPAFRESGGLMHGVQIWVALLGVFLSSAIGIFFGIYPAMRAAKLDPVVALRAE